VGWLTAAVVIAAVAINLAGIGAIAVAQRGVIEETRRLLRLEAEARAGTLEGVLASTRADLAFLTGSPIFFGLESALGSRDPREARWRRLEAEGARLQEVVNARQAEVDTLDRCARALRAEMDASTRELADMVDEEDHA